MRRIALVLALLAFPATAAAKEGAALGSAGIGLWWRRRRA
jgi:hypothetical protein